MKVKYDIQWLRKEVDKNVSLKYIYFWGHQPTPEISHSCFSQWYESHFEVEDTFYKTAEHWMMAEKANLFSDQDAFKRILASNSPGEAKELGRQVQNFNQQTWEEHRMRIVVEGNHHKFSQNKDLKTYLLNTNTRVLVEASPVDAVWGVGLATDNPKIQDVHNWQGLNLLGFALMEVRDMLKS